MNEEPSNAGTIVVVITALSGWLAIIAKWAVNAYRQSTLAAAEKLKIETAAAAEKLKYETAECHADDTRADAWANVVITRQQEEIAALRSDVRALQEEMKVMRQERLECERVQAELKTEVAYLRRQVQA